MFYGARMKMHALLICPKGCWKSSFRNQASLLVCCYSSCGKVHLVGSFGTKLNHISTQFTVLTLTWQNYTLLTQLANKRNSVSDKYFYDNICCGAYM